MDHAVCCQCLGGDTTLVVCAPEIHGEQDYFGGKFLPRNLHASRAPEDG